MDKLLILAAVLFPAVAGLFFYLWRRTEVRPVVPDDTPGPSALGPVIPSREPARTEPRVRQVELPAHLTDDTHYVARLWAERAFSVDESACLRLLEELDAHCLSGHELISAAGDGVWAVAVPGSPCHQMAWSTPLANREGRLGEAQIAEIGKVLARFAADQDLLVRVPDAAEALARAVDLDRFCAEVDRQIKVFLRGAPGDRAGGNTVRSVCELAIAEGLVEDSSGDIARYEENERLFTVRTREGRNLPGESPTRALSGLRIDMEITHLSDPAAAFGSMVEVARKLMQPLRFSLVNEQGIPLSIGDLEATQADIAEIHAKMDSRGIRPGSPTAKALFS